MARIPKWLVVWFALMAVLVLVGAAQFWEQYTPTERVLVVPIAVALAATVLFLERKRRRQQRERVARRVRPVRRTVVVDSGSGWPVLRLFFPGFDSSAAEEPRQVRAEVVRRELPANCE